MKRKSHRPPRPAPPFTSRERAGSFTPASPRRRLLFGLAAAILVPLLLLTATELVLRLAGYGYSTRFLRPETIAGQPVLVENDRFGLRFFPAALARSPAPTVLTATKAPGTIRIFILGESAALGDPRPAYGFGRSLEALLRDRYPGAKFEVVNAAMTAINSHAILPIAREIARYDGDFWIVYMGNNEFAGPFGANTIFGPQAPPAALVRARLAVQATRIGQALEALGNRWRGAAPPATNWTGLKLFLENELPPDDPRRAAVYANFHRNLADILTAGTGSGAQVILSSVASNLRDCPPFASRSGTNLAAADRAAWHQLLDVARLMSTNASATGALAILRAAVTEDPRFAEAQFRLAETELAASNLTEARRHFELARDTDALPFRADSRLNDIAAAFARDYAGRGVAWVDAAEVLATNTPAGVPGHEAFYEHVHLTPDGNYRLALAFAESIAPRLPAVVTSRARDHWASQTTVEQQLGLTDWNRRAVLESMLQRLLDAPYTNQLNHLPRLQSYWRQLKETEARLTPAARVEARQVYETALQRSPADFRLHENYAEFLEATGDVAGAATQWQQVRDLIPHHFLGWYQTGRLLARQQQYESARAAFQQALVRRPDLAEAYRELSALTLAENHPEQALALSDRALALQPGDARLYVQRAEVLAKLRRRDDAVASLREAVRLRPAGVEARHLLGLELATDGRLPEAQAEFTEVLRLRPDHVQAHLNLGIALAKQGRLREAAREFDETLRLDPLNPKALQGQQAIKALGTQAPLGQLPSP